MNVEKLETKLAITYLEQLKMKLQNIVDSHSITDVFMSFKVDDIIYVLDSKELVLPIYNDIRQIAYDNLLEVENFLIDLKNKL